MKTNHELKVEIVNDDPIALHGNWVKGEISTRTSTGEVEELRNPHFDRNLDISVWYGDEGKHQIHIDQSLWIYLTGLWGANNYINTELLRGEFSLAELMLIRQTLDEFIKGVETGTISSR